MEVWTLRGGTTGTPPVRDTGTPPVRETGTPSVREGRSSEPLHLLFLNYRTFGICLSPDHADGTLSAMTRRFCADVSLAVSGRNIEPVIQALKWPHGAAAVEPPADGAAAMFRQRLMGLPGFVVIFGRQAAQHLPVQENPGHGEVIDLDGKRILLVDGVAQVCSVEGAKKKLWQALLRLRS